MNRFAVALSTEAATDAPMPVAVPEPPASPPTLPLGAALKLAMIE